MKTQTFEIIASQSNIGWIGRKVTGSHNGTINIKSGSLKLEDNNIVSGQVVVDTTSIKILDVTDPATNAQFAGHLASDDFFASEQHPEAFFKIILVKGRHVEGDLTIKGITHPVSFDAQMSLSGSMLNATGRIIIDRTLYDMKFRSGNFFTNLGDTLIYNDFELNVSITAIVIAKPVLI